jgi:nitroimidazol reductase NimA-like FMN-containing flavoprotein (pyridoxamine 5'-phosphate oxidase superfamily)
MLFVQKDFEIEPILTKSLMAHLATVEKGEPRESPVWFIWEEGCLWIFGTQKDSFIKRLKQEPRCAVGIVDFDVQKGILRHVGIRGTAELRDFDQERLGHFLAKYLGDNQNEWNPWFVKHIVEPLNVMVMVSPTTIVAKDVSFFKTGPHLAE